MLELVLRSTAFAAASWSSLLVTPSLFAPTRRCMQWSPGKESMTRTRSPTGLFEGSFTVTWSELLVRVTINVRGSLADTFRLSGAGKLP